MDRKEWLKQMRLDVEDKYTRLWAPLYPDTYGLYENTLHRQFIARLLEHLSPASIILDAACGAGRYFSFLFEAGHEVIGIDQSSGMLDRARVLFPQVKVEKLGLQEMNFEHTFDAAICMDALENISPEDWPPVLSNFHQAIRSTGYFYFTLEMAAEEDLEKALKHAREQGLPAVYGEMPKEEPYHYYPGVEKVREWLEGSGFIVLDEAWSNEYHHFLTRSLG